jgi:hypothetical protein
LLRDLDQQFKNANSSSNGFFGKIGSTLLRKDVSSEKCGSLWNARLAAFSHPNPGPKKIGGQKQRFFCGNNTEKECTRVNK